MHRSDVNQIPTATEVRRTIAIAAPAPRVWEILTQPAQVKLWMSDGAIEIESEWVEGSPFVVRWQHNGKFEYRGCILAMEPEKLFRYSSWSRVMRLEDREENYATIEFRLETSGTETILTVVHSNLVSAAAPEHANFYWNGTLGKIRRLAEASG